MKTLDRYILKQLIAVTFLGVMSLTLLMLLGQLFKELHSLLVESGAPPTIVIDFILQVIPFSLTFTVPWGFLTAVLLVYGRLAADNELTSMRMAGLSLWRLSAPAIGLGVALSALCYYINIEVAPQGKNAMTELVLKAAMDNPKNLLNAGQGATRLDGVYLYTEGKTPDKLLGVHLYPIEKSGKANSMGMGGFSAAHAESATIGEFDLNSRILNLTLYNVTIEQKEDGGEIINRLTTAELPLQVHVPIRTHRKMKSNRFTNSEISELLEMWDVVRHTTPESMEKFSKLASQKAPFPCASNLWDAAVAESKFYHGSMTKKNEREFRTEGVQRASFACACIVFSLIGVPLAITARRRDTSTGFAIGIMVAALYFVALVFCETSRKSGGITPYIVLWLPNVLGIAFAIWQHAKAKYRG
ncbi:MAG: LptF/LptG family permease [Akkermansia sp.]|nr:LptF/LptG family permease [Akkermansia sp.]